MGQTGPHGTTSGLPMTQRLVAVAAALFLALGAAVPAAARPDKPGRHGSPVYLALGDSVAAGVGAQPRVTGYPEQVGVLLEQGYNTAADKATPNASGDFETINYALGGATTTTLIATQLPRALQLISQRSSDHDPFNDVEVLSLTIGGNDVFTRPIVESCLLNSTPAACQPRVDAALASIETNLRTILRQLTAAAGRGTEIILTTYYNPIGSCFLTQLNPAAPTISDVVLEGGVVPNLLTLEDGLNDVIREVAAASGVQVADLYGVLGPSQYVGGEDCLHPNLAGHSTIADVVYGTLAG
jgi:lysophospholipase L1-like esterase